MTNIKEIIETIITDSNLDLEFCSHLFDKCEQYIQIDEL